MLPLVQVHTLENSLKVWYDTIASTKLTNPQHATHRGDQRRLNVVHVSVMMINGWMDAMRRGGDDKYHTQHLNKIHTKNIWI